MKTNRKAGFTLIEIIIAMTLIAIFVTIPVFAYSSFTRSSRDTQRKNDINKIQGALEQYRANNGKYPPKETWLEDLVSGGYLPEIPTDPRNGQSVGDSSNLEYTYAYDVSDDGQTFELTSVLENPEAGGPGNPNEKSVYVVHPEGPKIAYTTPGIEGDPILPTTTGIAAPTIPFASRTPTPTRTPTPAAATPTPPAGCQYVAEACTNSIPPNCTYKLVCTTETPACAKNCALQPKGDASSR